MNAAVVRWLMAPDVPDEPLVLDDFLHRPEWHQRASCRYSDLRTFFSTGEAQLEIARAICAGCEVRQECHDTAMADPDLDGVWAGFTAKERRGMRRAVA